LDTDGQTNFLVSNTGKTLLASLSSTSLAKSARATRFIDDEIFSLFPALSEMMGRRGGDVSGGQQQQLAPSSGLR